MLWMLQNQLSRRNLNDFQRVEMVRKCEQAVKAQAEQRMLKGKSDPREIFLKGRATDELGELAGVSHKTYEHATAVLDNAPELIVQATRNAELSINAAYEVTKLPQNIQQEVSTRIRQGENAKKVITDVKKHKRSEMKYWEQLITNAEKIAKDSKHLDIVIAIMNQAIEILKDAAKKQDKK